MIPNNLWINDSTRSAYADRAGKPSYASLNLHTLALGPYEYENNQSEPFTTWWLFELVGTSLNVYKMVNGDPVFEEELAIISSATELSATFDQNGSPVIFNSDGMELELHWYDPVSAGYTSSSLGSGGYPFATFDMRYAVNSASSDVIIFYLRDGNIYYRQQRDRYDVEYQAPNTPYVDQVIEADMTVDYRLQLLYRYIDENYKPPTPQPPTQPDQPGSWSYFLNGYQSVIDFRADMLQLNTEFSIGIQLDSVELDKPDIALWSHQMAQVEGYSGGMMAVSFTGQSHNVVRVLYGGRVFESLAPFQLQPGHWLSEVTTEPTGTYLTVSVKPSGQGGYISHRVKVSPNYESSEYSSLKIGAMSGTRGRMMNCLRGSISAVTVVTPTYASGLKLAMDHNSYPETGLPGELQPILNTDGSPSGMDNAIIRDYRQQNWAFNPD
ncbi:hypothetical protein [Shewanella algae]|uniref:hypothetical protein n=1 Tax=Shewanella algae TaxID=38313 RepID=UPI0031F586A7